MKKIISIILAVCMVTGVMIFGVFSAKADIAEQSFINGDLGDRMEAILDSGDSSYIMDYSEELPSSYDISTSDCFPCVRSQGYYVGSCAAWATTYYQFGYQVAAMNNWNAKNDPTKQFSPKFTYNIVNGGSNEGSYKDDVYEVLNTSGAVRYSEFTPLSSEGTTEYLEWCTDTDALKEALKYRVSSYKRYQFGSGDTPITSYTDDNLDLMKKRLVDGYVLAFSTDFDTWDYKNLSSSVGSSHSGEYICIKQYDPENDDTLNDGHAMCIVGYDDTIKYDLNGDGTIQDFEKGAFKIVNSHGIDYCNQGFVWVMYDALNKTSNCIEQNCSTRNAIFKDNSYFVIEVAEYPCDLIAEVNITNSIRDDIIMKVGVSSLTSNYLQFNTGSLLDYNGGEYNFRGTGQTVQSATFPLDFSALVEYPTQWQKYYISLRSAPTATVINRIKIIDSSGKEVVNDAEEKTIRNTYSEYSYSLGLVGDVNNSGTVTSTDATCIQNHVTKISPLSEQALKVADVNADGNVNSIDSIYIQRVIAKIDSGFDNGVYAQID